MSGFEIAGIVLGAWPILLEGLKFYAEERGVIKDFCNCQPLIQSIYRQLKREKVTFENSAKCLIQAAAKQTQRPIAEVAAMMSSLEDAHWIEEDMHSDSIFSYRTAGLFIDTRQDLSEILTKIQRSLDKVPPKQPNKHTTKRQWERLMLAIKQDQIQLQLEKAETLNRFLVNLTRENVLAVEGSPKRPARNYHAFREQAILMAHTLHKKLLRQNCRCIPRHSANLVLEYKKIHRWSRNHYFRLLFGFESINNTPPYLSREMEVQATESYPDSSTNKIGPPLIAVQSSPNLPASVSTSQEISEPEKNIKSRVKTFFRSHSSQSNYSSTTTMNIEGTTKATVSTATETLQVTSKVRFNVLESQEKQDTIEEIQNLCVAISMPSEEASKWCGLLASHEKSRQEIKLACNPYFDNTGNDIKVISLTSILSTQIWKTKSRSKLGLQLASAILKFYHTPWLRKDWGKEDIFFVQEADGTILLDKPLIRPQFHSEPQIQTATINTNVPYLFALGVVLIELHYRKSVEDLQNEIVGLATTPGEAPEIAQMKRTLLMLQLIDKMDAGANLETALKQCIKGPDGALTDLNKEELRDLVEEKIIIPLENEVLWVHGCGNIEDCI